MRYRVFLGFLTLLTSLSPGLAGELAEEDQAEIMQAVHRWEKAWVDKDPSLAAQDYSDDADWTNAFGMRRIGRAKIQLVLEHVFGLPFVMAGSTEYEYHDFNYIEPTAVLVRSRAIRTNQKLPDGKTERPRKTNHLRVFAKRGDRWVIISHLISDERTPGKPRDD
jgi:uncharacterized protein (TIGR02246 family)